jgi:signal transduction histidine kinase
LVALRAFSLWRESKLRQEKVQLQHKVEERTSELRKKSEELTHSLEDLKSTQAQLIQSEKLASLGELTAGIAHEIQNPLNFVNNFSELSNELIKEMKEEFKKGETEEGFAIADNIEQNLEKINHHGKRASDIVKGMLEHTRTSTGQKELTDINALCGDYLKLAFHGLKAKEKDFNATMETHFDPNLPKIDIIPQDIGRVLLNLINNAFYACTERSRSAVNERNKQMEREGSPSGVGGEGGQVREPNYLPTVSITTQLTANSQLLIAVKDNGSGIPDAIKDKIFQPFFTTKPTGQGTGLGLSLSYDIVKAHGGILQVESTEGEGSIFIIQLPLTIA